jgi:hypothetical protein
MSNNIITNHSTKKQINRSFKIYNVEQLYKLKGETRNKILERIYTADELAIAEGYQVVNHVGFKTYKMEDGLESFNVAKKLKAFLEQQEVSGELLNRQLKLKESLKKRPELPPHLKALAEKARLQGWTLGGMVKD